MAVTEATVEAFLDHVRRRVFECHCDFCRLWGAEIFFRYKHEEHMKRLALLLKTLEPIRGLVCRGGIIYWTKNRHRHRKHELRLKMLR